MNRPIPRAEFDAELALVRYLVRERPWSRESGDNRALRAAYRRWTTSDLEPTPTMLAPLWQRIPSNGWRGLNELGVDRAVHHAAIVLHLLALGPEPGVSGRRSTNLGAAAKEAKVAEARFARLVNAPAPSRLETIGRLFRRFRQKDVQLHLTADTPEDGEFDGRSTRVTLRDTRRDDLAALLAFLFTDTEKPAISRWAAGYYRTVSAEQEPGTVLTY